MSGSSSFWIGWYDSARPIANHLEMKESLSPDVSMTGLMVK
jgi:hypothetical protein